MLLVLLKDRNESIKFNDYPNDDPIKFMMNFKKIFPSTFDLLLPILPDDETELKEISWESDTEKFSIFKKLIQEWATIEFRLAALVKYKDKNYANNVVQQANTIRKNFKQAQNRLNLLYADYVFLQAIHTLLDAELVELGANFYLPTLKANWASIIPIEILNQTVKL